MTTLKDREVEELQDLRSANDQMSDVASARAYKVSDSTLADRLSAANDGNDQHTRLANPRPCLRKSSGKRASSAWLGHSVACVGLAHRRCNSW